MGPEKPLCTDDGPFPILTRVMIFQSFEEKLERCLDESWVVCPDCGRKQKGRHDDSGVG